MKRKCKIILSFVLMLGMSLASVNVPLSVSTVNAAGESTEGGSAGKVLFYNDFSDAGLAGLEGEALAEALFGEGNYIFGHGATDATMKIENGALRLIGDDNASPTDGNAKNNRTQILLAEDEEITKKGVVIECDYTFNSGSQNAFAFVSKPIDAALKYIDSGTIWLSSIYSGKGYRTCLRTPTSGWEKPGYANTSDATYSTLGTTYNMKVEVSPTNGITLSAKKSTDSTYKVLQRLDLATIEAKGVTYANYLDNNVRLIYHCLCDVTIDNLKISLPEYENLFSSDFNDASLSGLEGEQLAASLFGEDNYIFGHAATDATMKIENGALRLIGDDNASPTDGNTKNNRTQILLANDASISDFGVMILCDYTFNSGSQNAFAFVSKPIDAALKKIESDNIWFSGIYDKGYRTCLRTPTSGWTAPGYANTSDTTYSTVGTTYNMKVEVSPANGITLSVKKSTDSTYKVLQRLDLATIKAAGVTYANYLDDNVRMILHCLCDVTIDNLEVNLLHKHSYTSGGKCSECGNFKDGLGALHSASVSLKGNVGLNFYMEFADEVTADEGAYVQFTLPDGTGGIKTEAVNIKDVPTRDENGVIQYKFSCDVAAKEMTDEVKLQIVTTQNGSGTVYTYSVKAYADAALASSAMSDEVKALIKAMLNYGAQAQKCFSYNTENLANADLSDSDKTITGNGSYDEYRYTTEGTLPDGVALYSTTLILKSETTIKCRFAVSKDVDVSKLSLSDGWTELKTDGRNYYTEYKNISAKDLAAAKELTISDGSNTWTLRYSPLSYAQQIENLAGADETLVNLTNALYDYYSAAAEYLNSVSE